MLSPHLTPTPASPRAPSDSLWAGGGLNQTPSTQGAAVQPPPSYSGSLSRRRWGPGPRPAQQTVQFLWALSPAGTTRQSGGRGLWMSVPTQCSLQQHPLGHTLGAGTQPSDFPPHPDPQKQTGLL